MNAFQANLNRRHRDREPYVLCREGGHWRLTFAGQPALFKHELGALYVAYLLLRHPAKEPLHAVALALKARESDREPAAPEDLHQQRQMGLPDAEAVRALWRRQRELERVLADRLVRAPDPAAQPHKGRASAREDALIRGGTSVRWESRREKGQTRGLLRPGDGSSQQAPLKPRRPGCAYWGWSLSQLRISLACGLRGSSSRALR